MGAPAFTPGPWSIDGRSLVVAPNPSEGGQYRTICEVRHNVATNAPLIAAAPGLYAFAEWAFMHATDRATVERARAILAKARGERS